MWLRRCSREIRFEESGVEVGHLNWIRGGDPPGRPYLSCYSLLDATNTSADNAVAEEWAFRMTQQLITDLDEIRTLAAARQETFQSLRETLEFDESLSDDALDAMVDEVAAPIAAAIDCTQCANCCRSLDVCLVPPDLDRLSTALHIPIEDVITRYADEDLGAVHGEWAVIPDHPCPFLRGNLCSIYANRPHSCRIYPQFTPDFRYNMEDTIEGASFCPIIYNVLDKLVERFESQLSDDG